MASIHKWNNWILSESPALRVKRAAGSGDSNQDFQVIGPFPSSMSQRQCANKFASSSPVSHIRSLTDLIKRPVFIPVRDFMATHLPCCRSKFIFVFMSLTVLASATCSSAQQIASATASGDLGIIDVINSINVKLGYEPISYALRYPLFENYQLTSVGQTFVANAQNDSHFLAFVQALTDGAVQSVGVYANPGAFYGQPEATFFDPLPAGNNGIDLQGYAISSVTMTVDSLTFERFIGGTYYTHRVTFRVYGVPRPKLVISPTGSSCSISWSPAVPGFILQETTSLSPANWTNSISGSTNQISVPITAPAKFYRLLKL